MRPGRTPRSASARSGLPPKGKDLAVFVCCSFAGRSCGSLFHQPAHSGSASAGNHILDSFSWSHLASRSCWSALTFLPSSPLPPGHSVAASEEEADVLAYALSHDEHGRPRASGGPLMASLAAEQLVQHLERTGFLILKQPPARLHSAG